MKPVSNWRKLHGNKNVSIKARHVEKTRKMQNDSLDDKLFPFGFLKELPKWRSFEVSVFLPSLFLQPVFWPLAILLLEILPLPSAFFEVFLVWFPHMTSWSCRMWREVCCLCFGLSLFLPVVEERITQIKSFAFHHAKNMNNANVLKWEGKKKMNFAHFSLFDD